ncbi:MAG: thioredoxin family protein [Gammaproteobacteria bacterium]
MGFIPGYMAHYSVNGCRIIAVMIFRTKIIFLFIMLLTATSSVFGLEQNPFAIPAYSTEYSPSRDPFIDGKNALLYAEQTNRKVLIEIGGDWCQWCHILDQFINDHPIVKQALYDHFVLLKVNVSEENKNKKFMSSLPEVDGYPHVYITDTKGSIKFSGDLSPLLEKGKFSEKYFLEFFDKWK